MGVFKAGGRVLAWIRVGGLLTALVAALVLWQSPRLTVPPEPRMVFVASAESSLSDFGVPKGDAFAGTRQPVNPLNEDVIGHWVRHGQADLAREQVVAAMHARESRRSVAWAFLWGGAVTVLGCTGLLNVRPALVRMTRMGMVASRGARGVAAEVRDESRAIVDDAKRGAA